MRRDYLDIGRLGGITGSHFFHYGSCPTRLWLYHRNIIVGLDNDHIKIGKHIDENTFIRNKKRFTIQGVCSIDFVEDKDTFEVHEIKKSYVEDDAHRYQVLFYMEVMSNYTDKNIEGIIHYYNLNKKVRVERDTVEVLRILDEIKIIVDGDCSKPARIAICSGCAYSEMCWA